MTKTLIIQTSHDKLIIRKFSFFRLSSSQTFSLPSRHLVWDDVFSALALTTKISEKKIIVETLKKNLTQFFFQIFYFEPYFEKKISRSCLIHYFSKCLYSSQITPTLN